MNNWIKQVGYPVIHIKKEVDEQNKVITYQLKQDYFLIENNKGPTQKKE
jgi:aminopeptidase N